MKTYNLSAYVTISVYTTVEADSLEEAIKEANSRSMMSIIPNNSESEEEVWIADELDGSPTNIKEA